jgi:hypothetical protein
VGEDGGYSGSNSRRELDAVDHCLVEDTGSAVLVVGAVLVEVGFVVVELILNTADL